MSAECAARELTRRAYFTRSAGGLGALALASLCRAETTTPLIPHHRPRARNCIFIFLAGGTSHIELFDPKPELQRYAGQNLPESFFRNERFSNVKREESFLMPSRFGFRRYGQSGLEMSELLPHIGRHADDLALIRSTHTDEFDHGPAEIFFSTGVNTPGRPSLGSWVTWGLGSESASLPAYVVLMTGRGPVSRSAQWNSSFLPARTAGVLFRNQGEPVLNLANPPGVTGVLQREQLDTIGALNQQHLEDFGDPRIQSRIEAYELAFRMQAAAPELINFAEESRETHDNYGTDRVGESGSFSRNCLLARRLVERGVRFVSIFHRRWDHHSGLHDKLSNNCRIVDRPIGVLLHDLKQRGLLDDTLVVWGTEFGRTPITENAGIGPQAGRDHHRFGYSTWMAGGGVRGGQAIGSTDEFGWHASEDRVHVNDLHATMLHLFGIDHNRLTWNFRGLDVRLTNLAGHIVPQVFS